MRLYAAAEDADGCHRDGCVFREDDVDVYETTSAVVKYSDGAQMTYSPDASMPTEGYRLAFDGTKARLKIGDYERQPCEVEHDSEAHLVRNFTGRRGFA